MSDFDVAKIIIKVKMTVKCLDIKLPSDLLLKINRSCKQHYKYNNSKILFSHCCLILNKVRTNPRLHLLCLDDQHQQLKITQANFNEGMYHQKTKI